MTSMTSWAEECTRPCQQDESHVPADLTRQIQPKHWSAVGAGGYQHTTKLHQLSHGFYCGKAFWTLADTDCTSTSLQTFRRALTHDAGQLGHTLRPSHLLPICLCKTIAACPRQSPQTNTHTHTHSHTHTHTPIPVGHAATFTSQARQRSTTKNSIPARPTTRKRTYGAIAAAFGKSIHFSS